MRKSKGGRSMLWKAVAMVVIAASIANGVAYAASPAGVVAQLDTATANPIIGWLLTPLSGSSQHYIAMSMAWHGRLMVLGMGLLTPPVVIVARFYKVTPQQDWPRHLDNPFWFVTHRRWGHAIGAIVVAGLGFALAGRAWQFIWGDLHAAAGWIVIVLLAIQILGAWLRGTHGGPVDPFTRKRRPSAQWPGDHFSMTRRRIVFEYVHKAAGYSLLAGTFVAIPSGLVTADAPRWMPIAMALWWLLMFGVFIRLQLAGRCVDTYQAIWGLDPELPGNRRRPIGIGIVRRSQNGEIRHRK
jgi:hypothetical protein